MARLPHVIMRWFAFDHLPAALRETSRPFGELARKLDRDLPQGREKDKALDFLLLSKDAGVRASMEATTEVAGPGTIRKGAVTERVYNPPSEYRTKSPHELTELIRLGYQDGRDTAIDALEELGRRATEYAKEG